MTQGRFQTLIFDLDDTLIPTTELFVPNAINRVHTLLKENGLEWSLEEFNEYRKKHISEFSHREIFKKVIYELPLKHKEHTLKEAISFFYSPQLPPSIPLIDGAEANLRAFNKKYFLFLLTGGTEKVQMEKVKRAGLLDTFQEIVVADEKWQFNKEMIIKDWIQTRKLNPSTTLSVGNSLKDEIRASKKNSIKTCQFIFGDHTVEKPADHFEVPDYKISHHRELISTCQL